MESRPTDKALAGESPDGKRVVESETPHATPDRAATVEQIITQRLGAWYRADYRPTEMDAKVAGDIAARLAHAGLTEIDLGLDACDHTDEEIERRLWDNTLMDGIEDEEAAR